LEDQAYGKPQSEIELKSMEEKTIALDTIKSFCWYDYALRIKGNNTFERRMAGRIETGLPSKTDPQMGNISIEEENGNA
jgi:phospholipase C